MAPAGAERGASATVGEEPPVARGEGGWRPPPATAAVSGGHRPCPGARRSERGDGRRPNASGAELPAKVEQRPLGPVETLFDNAGLAASGLVEGIDDDAFDRPADRRPHRLGAALPHSMNERGIWTRHRFRWPGEVRRRPLSRRRRAGSPQAPSARASTGCASDVLFHPRKTPRKPAAQGSRPDRPAFRRAALPRHQPRKRSPLPPSSSPGAASYKRTAIRVGCGEVMAFAPLLLSPVSRKPAKNGG
jgi:hypothetical protein